MNAKINIRKIKETDAESISELSLQLGYAIDIADIKKHIATILGDNSHMVYVAVFDNTVVGYIHGFRSVRLTSLPFFEICALVVKKSEQRKGIGKMLVHHIENQTSDCKTVRVRCNVKRIPAHKFYLKLGYAEHKSQKIFQKKLCTASN